jgi:hypothetical protein
MMVDGVTITPTYIPYGVSPQLADAALWWNDQVGAELFIPYDPLPSVVEHEAPLEPGVDGRATVIFSRHDGTISSCRIAIDPNTYRRSSSHLEAVRRHEAGHCLGLLEHDDDPSSIMHSPARAGTRVTPADRQRLLDVIDSL